MLHKPWAELRNTARGGDNEDESSIANSWKDCVKNVTCSGGTPPDRLQTEVGTRTLKRQLEINET